MRVLKKSQKSETPQPGLTSREPTAFADDPASVPGVITSEEQALPGMTAAEAGIDHLAVSSGTEKFSPVQFHTLEVGPVMATVHLKPTDDVFEKFAATHAMLERMVKHAFDHKLESYLERVRAVASKVEATRA